MIIFVNVFITHWLQDCLLIKGIVCFPGKFAGMDNDRACVLVVVAFYHFYKDRQLLKINLMLRWKKIISLLITVMDRQKHGRGAIQLDNGALIFYTSILIPAVFSFAKRCFSNSDDLHQGEAVVKKQNRQGIALQILYSFI